MHGFTRLPYHTFASICYHVVDLTFTVHHAVPDTGSRTFAWVHLLLPCSSSRLHYPVPHAFPLLRSVYFGTIHTPRLLPVWTAVPLRKLPHAFYIAFYYVTDGPVWTLGCSSRLFTLLPLRLFGSSLPLPGSCDFAAHYCWYDRPDCLSHYCCSPCGWLDCAGYTFHLRLLQFTTFWFVTHIHVGLLRLYAVLPTLRSGYHTGRCHHTRCYVHMNSPHHVHGHHATDAFPHTHGSSVCHPFCSFTATPRVWFRTPFVVTVLRGYDTHMHLFPFYIAAICSLHTHTGCTTHFQVLPLWTIPHLVLPTCSPHLPTPALQQPSPSWTTYHVHCTPPRHTWTCLFQVPVCWFGWLPTFGPFWTFSHTPVSARACTSTLCPGYYTVYTHLPHRTRLPFVDTCTPATQVHGSFMQRPVAHAHCTPYRTHLVGYLRFTTYTDVFTFTSLVYACTDRLVHVLVHTLVIYTVTPVIPFGHIVHTPLFCLHIHLLPKLYIYTHTFGLPPTICC